MSLDCEEVMRLLFCRCLDRLGLHHTVKLDVDVCYPNPEEDDDSSSTNVQSGFARALSSL